MLNDADRAAAYLTGMSAAIRQVRCKRSKKGLDSKIEEGVTVLDISGGWSSITMEGILKNILFHGNVLRLESDDGRDRDSDIDRGRERGREGVLEFLNPFGQVTSLCVLSPCTASSRLMRHSSRYITRKLKLLRKNSLKLDIKQKNELENNTVNNEYKKKHEITNVKAIRSEKYEIDSILNIRGNLGLENEREENSVNMEKTIDSDLHILDTNINNNLNISINTGNIIDSYISTKSTESKTISNNKKLISEKNNNLSNTTTSSYDIVFADLLEGSGLLRQNSLQELKFALDFFSNSEEVNLVLDS